MEPREKIEPHVWRIVAVFSLGAIMSVLDATIVNVALRDLSIELNAPLDQIQWVATGYLLAIAAVIPMAGWVTRRFGTRRVFIASIVLFTIGSLFCALAWSVESLIAFRILQGIGGGLVMPVGQILVVKAAGPKNLSRVMAVTGIPMLAAPILGPSLGGLLLEVASWHWIFLINVPIGVVTVFAATRLLPPNETEAAGRLDIGGFGLATAGAVAVTYGLAESGNAGSLLATSVLIPVLAGIALLITFVLRSLRIENPLLDVRLFAARQFAAAAAVIFVLGAMLFGGMILLPLYFQTVRGLGPLETGLLLAPQGIGVAISMQIGGRLTDIQGGGRTSLYGLIVTLIATVPFVLIADDTPYFALEIAMLARGMGLGMMLMPAMTSAYRKLDQRKVNDAAAQLTVIQRLGGSMGTAVLTVVLQNQLSTATDPAGAADAFGGAFVVVAVLALLSIIPVVILALTERGDYPGRRKRPANPLTPVDEATMI